MEALVATYGLGLASAASPCLLPLYPAFLAYLTGTAGADAGTGRGRRVSGFLGLAVLAGLITSMLIIGLVVVAPPQTLPGHGVYSAVIAEMVEDCCSQGWRPHFEMFDPENSAQADVLPRMFTDGLAAMILGIELAARIGVAEGPSAVERLNRERLATIGANLPPGVAHHGVALEQVAAGGAALAAVVARTEDHCSGMTESTPSAADVVAGTGCVVGDAIVVAGAVVGV